jgi:hypothetical protein
METGGGEAFVFIASGRAERIVVRADGWVAGLVHATHAPGGLSPFPRTGGFLAAAAILIQPRSAGPAVR